MAMGPRGIGRRAANRPRSSRLAGTSQGPRFRSDAARRRGVLAAETIPILVNCEGLSRPLLLSNRQSATL